jgi:C1A family cysteine protease
MTHCVARTPLASRRIIPLSCTCLLKVYKRSEAWRTAMGVSVVSACSKQAGSLCSSSLSAAELQALKLAAAPQTFDARSTVSVGPVKDQGDCGTW